MANIERVLADYGPILGRVAAAYTPPGADRDDLRQEIAMALVTGLPNYRGDSSVRTYVLRIAHNCGIRRIARRRAASAPLDESAHPASAPSPEQETASRQDAARLADLVRELPLGARQVLVLTLEGLSQREIAEVLGLEENVVSVRLHRARNALRMRLAEAPKLKGTGHG
jgi:RNA polymerase sigma-70 factor (ECF subfamily)